MPAEISAIIVNYNAGHFLASCVHSLLSSSLLIEIIVVDNASTDSSLAELSGLPNVAIVKNEKNLGFAKACNLGTRRATAPVLLYINPDCRLEPNTLSFLVAALRADPQVGMVGGLLMNSDGTEQPGGRRAVPTPWRSFVRAFGLSQLAGRWPRLFYDFHLHKQAMPEQPIEVEAISGACMMVSRAALQDVGEWDEGYFLHCEDLDWCMRFRLKGWKILFVPDALITHALGVSSKGRRIFVEWHKHKGMIRFYDKFFRHQYPLGLMTLVTMGVWFRFAMVAAYYWVRWIWSLRAPLSDQANTIPSWSHTHTQVTLQAPASQKDTLKITDPVGVLGASSFVGGCLLRSLTAEGHTVFAYSRKPEGLSGENVLWRKLEANSPDQVNSPLGVAVTSWVTVCPIAAVADYFSLLESLGVRRLVVLSSTSRFTKSDSTDPQDQALAKQFGEAEARIEAWATAHQVEWVVLRPTLIYGLAQDRNITEIVRFVRNFGFFPLMGRATGLRQPIHAQDVASACVGALNSVAVNRAYNISGAEILQYREMVKRIFQAIHKTDRMMPVPLFLFSAAIAVAKILPRYRKWSPSMAQRMNRDQVFDHSEASRDLDFKPRAFVLSAEDLAR